MKTPKITIKDYLLIGLFIVLLFSGAANWIQYHNISKAKASDSAKASIINSTIKDLETKVDNKGNAHVSFNNNQNIIDKETAAFSKKLDTVAQAIGIKKNDITEFTQVTATVTDKHLPAIKRDSAGVRSYNYKDKTFNIKFTEPRPGIDTIGYFDPSASINLINTQYSKRSWFLGALKTYTDIYSDDKRVKINNVNRLIIEQKEPSFGLRIRASSTYNPALKNFSAGPEAAFDIGRNQIRVNYYYNLQTQSWRPTFTYTRDIFRL